MTVNLKWVNKITFITNPDTLVTIIVQGKSMVEAVENAKNMFWFSWTYLEKAEWDNDCRIWTMKRSEYKVNKPEEIKIEEYMRK